MKLSAAIKAGATERPQARGGEYFELVEGLGLCSCALGAAFEGRFGTAWEPTDAKAARDQCIGSLLSDAFGVINVPAVCPVGGCVKEFKRPVLGRVISHLNDDHGWTREGCAEFAEGFERAA